MIQEKIYLLGGQDDPAYAYYTLELKLTERSLDRKTNTHLVDIVLTLYSGRNRFINYGIGATVKLDDQEFTHERSWGEFTIGYHDSLVLLEETAELDHKEHIAVTASIDMSKASYTPGNMQLEAEFPLSRIARGLGHIRGEDGWREYRPAVGGGNAVAYVRRDGKWKEAGGNNGTY